MGKEVRVFQGSALSISQKQPNDIYISITMRMFSTRPNRNGEAVTEAFIDEIVSNQDKYLCVPLCVDTKKLVRGDYGGLGHMLNHQTEAFLSEIIGAFSSFTKVEDEYGVSLIGEARVSKRNARVCEALEELYNAGKLNFSFEILAADVTVSNGITYIDASPNNTLFGMAVVSVPAYPEAKALAMVAEVKGASDAVLNISISEATYETLMGLLWEQLKALFGNEDEFYWEYRVERVCHDCLILYRNSDGRTIRVDYEVVNDVPVITDIYEVVYTRKESVISVSEVNNNTEIVEEIVENTEGAEVVAEVTEPVAPAVEESTPEVAENEAPEVEQTEEPEATEPEAEAPAVEPVEAADNSDKDTAIANLNKELEAAKAELAMLQEYKVIAEQAEADRKAKEIAAKKENLKKFAENSKLNLEDAKVAEAVEGLDYEALVSMTLASKDEPEKKTLVSGFTQFDGVEIKGGYGGILSRTGK